MRHAPRPPLVRRRRDAPGARPARGRAPGGRGLAALILLAGCGRYGQLEDGFEDTLTTKGTCGDVYFFAHDEEGSTLLEVSLPPVIEQVGPPEVTFTWTLPVPDVEITVTTGENVADVACSDVVVDGGPKVDQEWTATEGSLELLTMPDGDAVRGTLLIEDVRLEGKLQPVEIRRFEWPELLLGFLPG